MLCRACQRFSPPWWRRLKAIVLAADASDPCQDYGHVAREQKERRAHRNAMRGVEWMWHDITHTHTQQITYCKHYPGINEMAPKTCSVATLSNHCPAGLTDRLAPIFCKAKYCSKWQTGLLIVPFVSRTWNSDEVPWTPKGWKRKSFFFFVLRLPEIVLVFPKQRSKTFVRS